MQGVPLSRVLILASSSASRKMLLDRLCVPYQAIAPEIDESPQGESHADALAMRLAQQKATVIAAQYPEAVVIGSDQVAWLESAPQQFIGKPMTIENAIQQLQAFSGQTLCFSTAMSVQCKALNFQQDVLAHYAVTFRDLSLTEIERYVELEQPLFCAGSFKSEGLGISLFSKMQGDDPTALIGLPLMALCGVLRGVDILIK